MAGRKEILYEDFSLRLVPRILWDSNNGTAIRGFYGYESKPRVKVRKRRMTEQEYNAEGRAQRRKQHRFERGWLPYAQR